MTWMQRRLGVLARTWARRMKTVVSYLSSLAGMG